MWWVRVCVGFHKYGTHGFAVYHRGVVKHSNDFLTYFLYCVIVLKNYGRLLNDE